MSFKVEMIRGFFVASVCLFAQVIPAFAEKVTLACSVDSTRYVTQYLTIDTDAKTVKESTQGGDLGTYPAEITDDAVTWYSQGVPATYNRTTAQLSYWGSLNGYTHQQEPVPCVRAQPRPF
jgi:hypothetical protein